MVSLALVNNHHMDANMTMNYNDSISMTTNSSLFTGPPWSQLQKLLLGTWLTISMLCAVFGNLMVIVVVIRHKGMQTRTNMFLVNLAIADCLVGTLLAPFSLTTLIMDKWIFGEVMCHINGFMNAICFITSFQTLMYISIHKYVSITRPFSRVLNRRKILIMGGAAWLWAITCAVLTMFILSQVIYKPGAMQCGPEYPQNKLEYIHTSIISLSNIFIPLGIMIFAYARMYCEFRQHAMRMHENTTLQSDKILSQQLQITKTLFIVLACFMMCILPYFSYTVFVSMVKDKTKIPTWANPVAYCFMYMNSGCNPIIYAWRSPSFRQGYRQILCRNIGNVVSDDTVHESESHSIIRKLSVLLHSSFHSSRLTTSRNSDESLSGNSVQVSRNLSLSSPSHTLLKWATSKTAKGSSIIRKDGSIIITKNGKIISVRRDKDSIKRERNFNDFDGMFLGAKLPDGGVSRSVSEKDITDDQNRVELRPLLKMAFHTRESSASCASVHPSIDNGSTKFGHKSLAKIDSIDETETDINACSIKQQPPVIGHRSRSNSFSISQVDTDTLLQQNQEIKGLSTSMKSDLDDVFLLSSIVKKADDSLTITDEHHSSEENMLNSMCLVPVLKCSQKIAKSDMQLDHDDDTHSSFYVSNSKNVSQSSHIVNKVSFLRCPSIETLDVGTVVPRCSSDASTIFKLIPNASLFARRWLSNKNVDKCEGQNLT